MCCGVVHNSVSHPSTPDVCIAQRTGFLNRKTQDYARFEDEAADIAERTASVTQGGFGEHRIGGKICKKYRQKNTVGYCMNAFVDFEHPLDMLAHLIIGGEGTLAFIAEAVDMSQHSAYKMTAMLILIRPKRPVIPFLP